MRFISLGSGSSGNCYFLYTENDGLLVDAGIGVRSLKKYFKEYGLNRNLVRRILVTHDHADHIKSVGSLSHDMQLPVYATRLVHSGIDRNYCVQRKVAQELRRIVVPGEAFQAGEFHVSPFTVPHDSSDNVGYLIEADGSSICIVTDAGEVTPDMGAYIGRTRNLVIEANHDQEMLLHGPYPQYLKERILSTTGHLCNTACAEAIANNMNEQLQNVWLCHLSEENNHPELARKTVEAVLRSYGIITGKDIQLEILKRTIPTGIFDL